MQQSAVGKRQVWSAEEQRVFLNGLVQVSQSAKQLVALLPGRSVEQIQSHIQKTQQKSDQALLQADALVEELGHQTTRRFAKKLGAVFGNVESFSLKLIHERIQFPGQITQPLIEAVDRFYRDCAVTYETAAIGAQIIGEAFCNVLSFSGEPAEAV